MPNPPALKGNILIVDDELTAVENLAHICCKQGHQVTTHTSGEAAIACLEQQTFDLILTDLRMEHVDGMAILTKSQQIDSHTAVILITGNATIDSAIHAMKAGAFHYIAKPFRLDEVREMVNNALEMVFLKRENKQLKQQLHAKIDQPIITHDPQVQHILRMAQQAAPTLTKVLITGESGTGKELLARYIHQHSDRHTHIFQAINCGALPENRLDNELFGHEKGAYSGATEARLGLIESSNKGTLFLDEIAEMSLVMQVKLLRVLQENELHRVGSRTAIKIDIRLICATHRDLAKEVDAGRFRQDLYYRLDVVSLHLPPLRDRIQDIALLAFHFLRKYSAQMHRPAIDIDKKTLTTLSKYDYPGNIRELANIIERAVTLSNNTQLNLTDLPAKLTAKKSPQTQQQDQKLPTLIERERDYIQYVLDQNTQSKTHAAKILGIDRVSLWRKLKKYGLDE